MRHMQHKRRGNRWPLLALLVVFGASVFPASAASSADVPDSTHPGLRDSVYVPKYREATKQERSPVALAAFECLKENTAEKWGVIWDDYTGLPRTVTCVTEKTYPGEATDIAVAFAEDHKELLAGIKDRQLLADYSFSVARTKTLRLETAVTLNSHYRGVTILNGDLGVFVSNDGQVKMVNNSFKPLVLADLEPSLSDADIEKIIQRKAAPDPVWKRAEYEEDLRRKGLPTRGLKHDERMKLVIYPSSPPRLAYRGYRFIREWWWDLIIDAHTGETISSRVLGIADPGFRRPPAERPGDSVNDSASPGLMPFHPVQPMRHLPDVDKRGLDTFITPQPPPPQEVNPQHQQKSTSSEPKSEPAYPNMECWFYEVNFLPGTDGDGDGYIRWAMIEWDADTWIGLTEEVTVAAYGWVNPGDEYLLFEFGPYILQGHETDWWSEQFYVPFQGEWSFRLELYDSEGILRDEYPTGSEPDSTMEDVLMESPFEDMHYMIHNVNIYQGDDIDGDGFPLLCSCLKLPVTHVMSLYCYLSDGSVPVYNK